MNKGDKSYKRIILIERYRPPKIKAKISRELIQDLSMYSNIDIEFQIKSIIENELGEEINICDIHKYLEYEQRR